MIRSFARVLLVIIAFGVGGCDSVFDVEQAALRAVQPASSSAYPPREFQIAGYSYGPNFEEIEVKECIQTYEEFWDSVYVPVGPFTTVRISGIREAGCFGGVDEGPYKGGNATYDIRGTDLHGSVDADGASVANLENLPSDPNALIHFTAWPDFGYAFIGWSIEDLQGQGNRVDYNQELAVSLASSDYRFVAQFKKIGADEP